MANLAVKDGAAADKYLKTSGIGTDVDPHVPEHLETNSAAILAAVDGVEALLTTIDADTSELAAAIDGELQVDVVTSALPTGAATSAKQDTQTTHLATVAGAVSGTEMQVDVLTSALPTGAATAANQATIVGHVDGIEALLTTIDGDTGTLAVVGGGTEATALRVTLATDSTGVVSVDDGGGALTVDGTVAVTHDALTELAAAIDTELQVDVVTSALPTGAATAANQATIIGHVDGIEALLTTVDGDTSTLAGAVSGTEMQVDVVGALPAGDNNIGNVDVASIAAGENLIGLVGASDIVVTITPTVAAEAHSAGDLLFDSTAIENAVRANGGTAIVQSITIVDIGDQKPSIHLLFANAATDFGAPGGAPDPDDNEAATVIGVVEVDTADYVDLGGASVVTVSNIGLLVKAGAATTSIYLAGIAVGTPTPASTSDYSIAIGLLRS